MSPFPIQELALPIALAGHDIIGQARTGTGKTFAFGIPLLQRVEHGGKKPQALVLVPTRELAVQVTDDIQVAAGKLGSRVLSVYGGRAYEPQIDALKSGVEVVVGTPGRLLDLVKQKHLDLSQVCVLVLDEADRMLDLGFLPDIERLVSKVPERRQTMLFSATMPGEIVTLSRKYLSRPTNVRAESHEESEDASLVVQHVYQAHQMDKPELLARVLQARGRGLTMVFCQTKRACDRVAEDLAKRGFAAAAVHGDLGQGQRERALRAFRSGKIDVLVATDVAARGLDVDDVTHVVNYECPDGADTYVHRIGRTARAGKKGIAITLVDWRDLPRWKLVNTQLDLPFADPVETYSTSENLYADLDIPSDITGTLPRAQRERAGLEAEEVEDIGETGRTRSKDNREHEERPARKPRERSRKRTRNGRLAETDTPQALAEPPTERRRTRTTDEAAPAEETAPRRRTRRAADPEAPQVEETEAPRRRTRRAAEPVDAEGSPPAETTPTTRRRTRTAEADVITDGETAEAPATRRRTRVVEAEVETPVTDGTVADETPTTRRRTRARADVEVPVTDGTAADEAAEAPTRRRRTRVVEAPEEASAPRRRTRAAQVEMPAEDAPERPTRVADADTDATEAPRRRSRRAAVPVEAEAPQVEETEAPRARAVRASGTESVSVEEAPAAVAAVEAPSVRRTRRVTETVEVDAVATAPVQQNRPGTIPAVQFLAPPPIEGAEDLDDFTEPPARPRNNGGGGGGGNNNRRRRNNNNNRGGARRSA